MAAVGGEHANLPLCLLAGGLLGRTRRATVSRIARDDENVRVRPTRHSERHAVAILTGRHAGVLQFSSLIFSRRCPSNLPI